MKKNIDVHAFFYWIGVGGLAAFDTHSMSKGVVRRNEVNFWIDSGGRTETSSGVFYHQFICNNR